MSAITLGQEAKLARPAGALRQRALTLPLAWLMSLAVVACSDGGLSTAVAALEVPSELVLPRAYVGDEVRTALVVKGGGTGRSRLLTLVAEPASLEVRARLPASVDPGEERALPLTWHVEAASEFAGTLTLEALAPDAVTYTIAVRGAAVPIPDCDDGNPCTDDRFDRPTERCEHRLHERECDDGSACTSDDRCEAGVCRGRAVRCDDDDVCTLDLCDPAVGCTFPPDERVCDDGDPCTKNVCNKVIGCTYPDADNGTPCGTVDCADAHLCFSGECRRIDVSDYTDGLPCSDGNACTDGDVCRGGECTPGEPAQAAPVLLASLETFGGEGSKVAGNGELLLFADLDATRVVRLTAETTLEHTATVPVVSRVRPVAYVGATFMLATTNALVLIEATNAEHPSVLWSHLLHPFGALSGGPVAAEVTALERSDRGAVVALRYAEAVAATLEERVELIEVEIGAGGFAPVGSRLLASASSLADVSVRGDRMAWIDEAGVLSMGRIADAGFVDVASVALAGSYSRVAVFEGYVVALAGSALRLYSHGMQASVGDEDPVAVLKQRAAMGIVLDTKDVAIRPATLGGQASAVLVGADGLFEVPLYFGSGSASFGSVRRLSEIPATTLALETNYVLTSGRLALPYLVSVDDCLACASALVGPWFTELPLTGPRHGSVRSFLELDEHRVRLVGAMTEGVLDTQTLEVSGWQLVRPSTTLTPRFLTSGTAWATPEPRVGIHGDPLEPRVVAAGVCAEPTFFDGAGVELPGSSGLCWSEPRVAAIAGRLVFTAGPSENDGPESGMLEARWPESTMSTQLGISWTIGDPYDPTRQSWRLHAAPRSPAVALVTSGMGELAESTADPAPMTPFAVVTLLVDESAYGPAGELPLGSPQVSARATFLVQGDEVALRRLLGEHGLATDGTDLLIARSGTVSHVQPLPDGELWRDISLAAGAPHLETRAFALDHTRAWLGWIADDGVSFMPQPLLGSAMIDRPLATALPGLPVQRLPDAVHDLGTRAVAADPVQVLVLKPGCLP